MIWNYQLKKEIRKRRRIERKLKYRLGFENLILEMSSHFIGLKKEDTDAEINQALSKIAKFVSADLGYLFKFSDDGSRFFHTHSWQPENVRSIDDLLKESNVSTIPWWISTLKAGNSVVAPIMENLPVEATKEKDFLNSMNIKSRADIPLIYGGSVTGFLGISSCQDEQAWSEDEVYLLRIIGQIFTNGLGCKKAEEALQNAQHDLEERVEERTLTLTETNKKLQHEIIERKRMEVEKDVLSDQLQHARKMEAIGTLAASIAHDFNNLLTPIIGYSELSLKKFPRETVLQDNLDKILNAAFRAKELVGQILAFSRQKPGVKKIIRLEPIIREVLNLLKASLPATIEIHEPVHLDNTSIFGDSTQIHQVLMSLTTNTYHAMKDRGGILTVSLKHIDFNRDDIAEKLNIKPGKYIKMSVIDTGHGIDPQMCERIFEPYFTTKTLDSVCPEIYKMLLKK